MNSTQNISLTSHVYPEEELVTKIQMYYTPLLVLLGTAGNCLSVVVFATAKLRQLSSSYYLAGLALSDTGYLLSDFFVWLNLVNVPLFNEHGFCQLITYGTHLCSFLSVWFVVAFTAERFVAVRYPLHRPSMCTVTRAKSVLLCLTLLGIVLYGPLLFLVAPIYVTTIDKETCMLLEEHEEYAKIFNIVDTVLTFLLPFVAIVVLNAGIASTVWRLARIRRNMTRRPHRASFTNDCKRGGSVRLNMSVVKNDCDAALGTIDCVNSAKGTPRAMRSQHSAHSQAKITKMLLLVSTVFVLLNLPSYLFRLWVYIRLHVNSHMDPLLEDERRLVMVLQHVSNLLFSTNSGINFLLYCVSGQNFRRALSALCCSGASASLRRRRGAEISQTTAVSEYQRAGSFLSRRRTTNNVNGAWREAHEMLPLNNQ